MVSVFLSSYNYFSILIFQEIGHLIFGGEKCMGTALHHWNEVFSWPDKEVSGWHNLSASSSLTD